MQQKKNSVLEQANRIKTIREKFLYTFVLVFNVIYFLEECSLEDNVYRAFFVVNLIVLLMQSRMDPACSYPEGIIDDIVKRMTDDLSTNDRYEIAVTDSKVQSDYLRKKIEKFVEIRLNKGHFLLVLAGLAIRCGIHFYRGYTNIFKTFCCLVRAAFALFPPAHPVSGHQSYLASMVKDYTPKGTSEFFYYVFLGSLIELLRLNCGAATDIKVPSYYLEDPRLVAWLSNLFENGQNGYFSRFLNENLSPEKIEKVQKHVGLIECEQQLYPIATGMTLTQKRQDEAGSGFASV